VSECYDRDADIACSPTTTALAMPYQRRMPLKALLPDEGQPAEKPRLRGRTLYGSASTSPQPDNDPGWPGVR